MSAERLAELEDDLRDKEELIRIYEQRARRSQELIRIYEQRARRSLHNLEVVEARLLGMIAACESLLAAGFVRPGQRAILEAAVAKAKGG